MNEADIPTTSLSALEITGAISGRIIHDLSNLISGILGNAEYAQQSAADPASLQKAIRAISASANSAGKLLGQCLPLQRLVSGEAFPFEAGIQAAMIAESAGLAPGWRTAVPPELAGQICVQPRWLSAAIWQIARETEVSRGDIEFACGPPVFPVVWRGANSNANSQSEFFQISLHYRSDQMLFSKDGPVNPERFGLLAAHELIRRFKGQIHSCLKPPGRQEIWVLIPLLADPSPVMFNGN
ncbi:MAG TPA: hypothetical protein VFC07_03045 [Verrucomicrobiae bacterium]|nr:hypothetical protein [Verrucomicrobiae bacterium]